MRRAGAYTNPSSSSPRGIVTASSPCEVMLEARLCKNIWFCVLQFLELEDIRAFSSVNHETRHSLLSGWRLTGRTLIQNNAKSAWLSATNVLLGSNVAVSSSGTGIMTMCLSKTGNLIVSSREKVLSKWDIEQNWVMTGSVNVNNTMNIIRLLPCGLVAVGTYSAGLQLWEVDGDMECRTTLKCLSSVHSLEVDGKDMLISGHSDGNIHVWNTTTHECLKMLHGHTDWIYSMTLIRNCLIASGSDDETIRIWNTSTGECVTTLSESHCAVSSLCSLSSHGLLASGHWDKKIRIWDNGNSPCENEREISAITCIKVLEGHRNAITSLCQLSDGTLVSGSSDKLMKIWSISTSSCVRTIKLHSGYILSILVHPDCKRIISGGMDDSCIFVSDLQLREETYTENESCDESCDDDDSSSNDDDDSSSNDDDDSIDQVVRSL